MSDCGSHLNQRNLGYESLARVAYRTMDTGKHHRPRVRVDDAEMVDRITSPDSINFLPIFGQIADLTISQSNGK